jgi:cell division protease FtsH
MTTLLIWIALFGYLICQLIAGTAPKVKEIPYSVFKSAVDEEQITSVLISDTDISREMKNGTAFITIRVNDPDLIKTLEARQVEITGQVPNTGGVLSLLLTWILPLLMIGVLWYFLFARNRGGANSMGGIFSFGKSKARVIIGEQTGVSFKDVGGEAITDLKEVTEFLTDPVHFQEKEWTKPG